MQATLFSFLFIKKLKIVIFLLAPYYLLCDFLFPEQIRFFQNVFKSNIKKTGSAEKTMTTLALQQCLNLYFSVSYIFFSKLDSFTSWHKSNLNYLEPTCTLDSSLDGRKKTKQTPENKNKTKRKKPSLLRPLTHWGKSPEPPIVHSC